MTRFTVRLSSALVVGAGFTALLAAGTAHALVLADKSAELKFRSDVGKQTAAYLKCVIKAAQKCEKAGALAGQECDLVAQVAAPPADPKAKFPAALAKCASKVNMSKKAGALTYESIGCPGDCDPVTAGPQRCANLQAYQDFTLGDTGTRATVNLQGAALPPLTGCADNAACLAESVRYSKFALGSLKCMGACEGDYKGKKGNGGPVDAGVCHLPITSPPTAGGSDPVFVTCITKALASAEKKGGPLNTPLKDAISGALNNAVDYVSNITGGNCGP
ncbi:MAG: hypothetical protein ABI629_11180 [bacterium]